ncbi:putative Heat shock protein DnaJ, cysteine-rich domain superfamily [Helianthus annuus]|nr:putative Heat shock protein DnaJ, cysteine-rich domain superfamily [Helianthus annuus]
MDCAAINYSPSITLSPLPLSKHLLRKSICFGNRTTRISYIKIEATSDNAADFPSGSQLSSSTAVGDMHRKLSTLESLFCYDKAVPEEIIEKPVGLSLSEKNIGNKTRCSGCEAKGAILCATCSGSGLYVDSIMESQGIIVKVRCLGCGGSGNIMCSECGGRGHRAAA